jgi:ADP-heptose:LPS heptosyltransferase
LASTSCNEIAQRLLAQCLAGGEPDLWAVRELVDRECSDALFRIVVEGLADRFEPRLCDAYADIFSEVIGPDAAVVRSRYERVRRVRVCSADPKRVYVLSRVTLGADIAITSVMLDAAKRRFPGAEIVLVGSAKAAELFAGDPRIGHYDAAYPRVGSLRERLGSGKALALADAASIVIDPDSRLTQLGLFPVCAEENYFFFESRGYGGDGDADLSTLAGQWAQATFGVQGEAYLPITVPKKQTIAVSLGVGENPAKRVDDEFEAGLMRYLASLGKTVVVDKGAGGEEAERVERAIAGLPNVTVWEGSFAGFARLIAASDLYVGYDSAGQHAAAALGVPLVTVFAGYVSERMFQRWRPSGRGPIRIVKTGDLVLNRTVLQQTIDAIRTL